MAEKRMVSKVISISEKVNMLPDIFDMLLFTWMIPHTDDFGRLAGSPAKVKALVVPMLDKTLSDVEASLARLCEKRLILWYEVNGEKIIQIENFEKHQQGLHKRTKSKFPDFPGNSGKFPEIPSEQNRTEQKGTEENRTEYEQIFGGGDSFNPYRIFEQEGFGTISPVIKDQIDDLVETYGDRWYQEAMKTAVVAGKRSIAYVNGILKRWKTTGIDEPWKEDKQREEPQGNDEGVRSGRDSKKSEFAFLDEQNRTGPR
ncbi:DnaD domain protein [Paenibacillus sp. M1]|uniref:DnaD domain protein n=1 Tax=Paenibacillus haidiansis TaxID=1574488 RepID=A0ABU7VMS4_9BACL